MDSDVSINMTLLQILEDFIIRSIAAVTQFRYMYFRTMMQYLVIYLYYLY